VKRAPSIQNPLSDANSSAHSPVSEKASRKEERERVRVAKTVKWYSEE